MPLILEPGSVILTPEEVVRLHTLIERWQTGSQREAVDFLIDLGIEVRELLRVAEL